MLIRKKRQTHPAQWDGLEGNGGTHSVIFADAEIQNYSHPKMDPRIREVDQSLGHKGSCLFVFFSSLCGLGVLAVKMFLFFYVS